jgi:hypothetical protein
MEAGNKKVLKMNIVFWTTIAILTPLFIAEKVFELLRKS